MPNLGVGVWNVNAEHIPNDSAAVKLNNLHNMIVQSFRKITADFYVFVIPEFYFMHASLTSNDVRWFTETERDEVLAGLANISRLKDRFLLVGGTICWYKTSRSLLNGKQWKIYNQAPVFYRGNLIKLHGKVVPGGEVVGHDSLRVAESEKGGFDKTITVKEFEDGTNQPFWKKTGVSSLTALSRYVNETYRDHHGDRQPVAPTAAKMHAKYHEHLAYQRGTGQGSFDIPGTNFTGGVEVCMEHSNGIFQANSVPTNFHIVTANTVTCHAPEVGQTDHTHLDDPGIFIYSSAGDVPKVVTKNGANRTLENNWQDVANLCKVIEIPLPVGL